MGAVEIALAMGAEKLKDTGYGGLPTLGKGNYADRWMPYGSAPRGLRAAGRRLPKCKVPKLDLKGAIGRVSWTSHQNGVKNPKLHLRKAVDKDTILNTPMMAEPLGVLDCCGVSDGAACAIVTTPEIARAFGKQGLVTIKTIQLSASVGREWGTDQWDCSYVQNTRNAAKAAYREAGINCPRYELSAMEEHNCFSITELVSLEDLRSPTLIRLAKTFSRGVGC